ncbi:MAG: cell envelope integrity EipB family protein [Pseudomonadota bacterium]
MNRPAFLSVLPLLAVILPAHAAEPIKLQPHRAVYDISLTTGKGRNNLTAASGQLSYEFSGNACEGYSTKTAFTTALQAQDGKALISEMRSASFEGVDSKDFTFVTSSKSNGKLDSEADGAAKRNDDGALMLQLNKPQKEKVEFGKNVLLPAQHTLELIRAAKEQQNVLQADFFDGSESGKKLYATTAIIGKEVALPIPNEHPTFAQFAKTPRYPISISFYDKQQDKAGEQLPLYDLHATMFDNGVTYKLRLDYPDFSLEASMKSLELLPAGTCN